MMNSHAVGMLVIELIAHQNGYFLTSTVRQPAGEWRQRAPLLHTHLFCFATIALSVLKTIKGPTAFQEACTIRLCGLLPHLARRHKQKTQYFAHDSRTLDAFSNFPEE
eukprot:IDg8038t1